MDRYVIVTGSSRGIGRTIAIEFSKRGYNVALNCRDPGKLDEGEDAAELCRANGVKAACYLADVCNGEECLKLIKSSGDELGQLAVIVNNAGVIQMRMPFTQLSEDEFERIMRGNVRSVFNMMKTGAEEMKKKRFGRIINIASAAGMYSNSGSIAYSASKAAVISMTVTAAKELGSYGITVNAVAPGFVESAAVQSASEAQKRALLSTLTIKRFAKPEEIAGAVCYLASDNAGYITGTVSEISGLITV